MGTRHTLACAATFALALSLVRVADARAQSRDDDWATIESVTAKYADPEVALADGYVRDPSGMCVSGAMVGDPALGSMGVHYFRPDLLGITSMDLPIAGSDGEIAWDRPEVLVYEPGPDGETLVAVEYLVFQDAWKAAGNESPPAFHEQEFYAMADDPATEADEAHAFSPHYELHVWSARENPEGTFAEFNPAVTCPEADPHAEHAAGG